MGRTALLLRLAVLGDDAAGVDHLLEAGVPVAMASIDARKEYRAFDCVDLPLEARFYAARLTKFSASGNGSLLFDEMREFAPECKSGTARPDA